MQEKRLLTTQASTYRRNDYIEHHNLTAVLAKQNIGLGCTPLSVQQSGSE
jgi:hypothetical protein